MDERAAGSNLFHLGEGFKISQKDVVLLLDIVGVSNLLLLNATHFPILIEVVQSLIVRSYSHERFIVEIKAY